MRSAAEVEVKREKNQFGVLDYCVYAECLEGSTRVGPVWGDGEASVRRVLAMLTEKCDCGADWHYDEDGDDEE